MDFDYQVRIAHNCVLSIYSVFVYCFFPLSSPFYFVTCLFVLCLKSCKHIHSTQFTFQKRTIISIAMKSVGVRQSNEEREKIWTDRPTDRKQNTSTCTNTHWRYIHTDTMRMFLQLWLRSFVSSKIDGCVHCTQSSIDEFA